MHGLRSRRLPRHLILFVFLQVLLGSWNLGQLVSTINCYMSGNTRRLSGRKNTRRGRWAYTISLITYSAEKWLVSMSQNKNNEDRKRYFRTESKVTWNAPTPTPKPTPHPVATINIQTLSSYGRTLSTHLWTTSTYNFLCCCVLRLSQGQM